jgi:hypothetical protein
MRACTLYHRLLPALMLGCFLLRNASRLKLMKGVPCHRSMSSGAAMLAMLPTILTVDAGL